MLEARGSSKQKRLWIVLAVLVLATLACGTSESTAAPIVVPTNAPAATQPPITAPTKQSVGGNAGTLSLAITNGGDADVCEVFIASVDVNAWGNDQLKSKKILPGGVFTISDIPSGVYDLEALDCSGNVISRQLNQDMSGGDLTWTIQRDTVKLTIVNKSDSIGCHVFIAAPDDKYWGPNVVADGTKINPGDSITISGISPGIYDIRVETCSGNYHWDSSKVDLTSDFTLNMNN